MGRNVAKKWTKMRRREYLASPARVANQQKAMAKRKRVVFVEANPNNLETNKPFIRRVVTYQSAKSLRSSGEAQQS